MIGYYESIKIQLKHSQLLYLITREMLIVRIKNCAVPFVSPFYISLRLE